MSNENIPMGWGYNPSSRSQRIPIVAMALIGSVIATYLALYQYKVFSDVFEPFFGQGSRIILDSKLSRALPVSDAALGALAYLADAITGIIGGEKRWQTMPWIVIIFAIFVGPLGLVSLGLVMAQPLMYSAWCTLCLVSAVISIVMIGPAMDEALASLQYLRRVKESGNHSLWKTFWGIEKESEPLSGQFQPEKKAIAWPQVLTLTCGIWLMFAPEVLHYGGAAKTISYITGPLIFTFGMIAIWDATRSLRWVNIPLGIWMLMAPWIFGYPFQALINSLIVGLFVCLLSFVPSPTYYRMGGGWSKVRFVN